MRVWAFRGRLREPTAAWSLARSLARSPRYASRPTGEKPHLKPFRRYQRLSPGGEIELLLGAPRLELRSARLPRRALRFPSSRHRREGAPLLRVVHSRADRLSGRSVAFTRREQSRVRPAPPADAEACIGSP